MELNIKSLTTVCISVTIMVVLFSALLLPSLGSAQNGLTESVAYSNVAEDRVTLASLTDTYENTISFDSTGVTTSSGFIPIWEGASWNTLFISDVLCVWANTSTVQAVDLTSSVPNVYSGASCTLSISGGEVTYTVGSDTATHSFTSGYAVDPNGAFVSAYSGTTPMYYKDLDSVSGWRISSNVPYLKINEVSTQNGATYTNLSVNSTVVDDTEGTVYNLTSIGFGSKALTSYILPAEVEYTYTTHPAESALISVIPFLVLIGLILGAIGAVIVRRD